MGAKSINAFIRNDFSTASLGVSMSHTESKTGKVFESVAVFGVGVPVVGLLMGGIYSVPAMSLCKDREPWLSVLLSLGLAITVFGLGYLSQTPILLSTGAWNFSVVLLLVARRSYGALDGNLERFGLVHAVALLIAFVLAALSAHGISVAL
jgi:hypothetical protein